MNSGLQRDDSLFSYPLYVHLRDEAAEEFTELAGFQANTLSLGVRRAGAAYAESFPGQFVSGNYFTMFGVRPAAGRLIAAGDDRAGAPPVFVMSHRVWAQNFGQDLSLGVLL